jgi:hypothetical protein
VPTPQIEWQEPVQQPVQQLPVQQVPFNNNLQNSFAFSGGFDANDAVHRLQIESFHPHGVNFQWSYHHPAAIMV